jgi:hypothetical protein
VLPKIRARHRQRRADEAAVGLCACESGGSRRGPARLRERRRARGGLEERDARPLGCRLPRDALVERVAAKCSRLCTYRWSGYSSPCTRKMKMQRGLKKPLESVGDSRLVDRVTGLAGPSSGAPCPTCPTPTAAPVRRRPVPAPVSRSRDGLFCGLVDDACV